MDRTSSSCTVAAGRQAGKFKGRQERGARGGDVKQLLLIKNKEVKWPHVSCRERDVRIIPRQQRLWDGCAMVLTALIGRGSTRSVSSTDVRHVQCDSMRKHYSSLIDTTVPVAMDNVVRVRLPRVDGYNSWPLPSVDRAPASCRAHSTRITTYGDRSRFHMFARKDREGNQ
jgi:hypothetical protein